MAQDFRHLVVATTAAKALFAAPGQWNSSVDVELSAQHAENSCCNFRRAKWVLVEVLCCGSWAFRFPSFCCWRCFGITDFVVTSQPRSPYSCVGEIHGPVEDASVI
jgi:hypothetical protein